VSAHNHGGGAVSHNGARLDGAGRSERRERRLSIALGLNLVIVVLQVVLGLSANSLGLLSDAGHNLTDVAALGLSLIAVRVARRKPTLDRSFGWHRGTILAAQANAAMILILTVWIVYEAVTRLMDPPAVEGGIVLVVALVAFAVNSVAALVVREKPEHGAGDLNMRSALLHLTSDALASLGVAIAGAVMLITGGWTRLDPLVSLLIGLLIAGHAWRLLKSSTAVLLEGTPDGLDLAALHLAMTQVDGVEAVHDLHVWSLSSEVRALSAHLVIDGHPSLEEAQVVGNRVKQSIAVSFEIAHATLELECETCEEDGPSCEIELVEIEHQIKHSH